MNAILNAITIATLILIIAYLGNRHVRLYQALWWWQDQQLADDYAESEGLRNQALQSLFGIRRQMEQLEQTESIDRILEEVHHCQQDLTQLSDRLFSAYDFESLPLALKDLWNEILNNDVTIALEVRGNLAHRNHSLSSGQMLNGQLLLVWLRKILKAGLAEAGLVDVCIDLIPAQMKGWRSAAIDIKIRFRYRDLATCQRLVSQSELQLMGQMFSRLTLGRCSLKQEDHCVLCCISWRLSDRS